jgi:hypothetical protein
MSWRLIPAVLLLSTGAVALADQPRTPSVVKAHFERTPSADQLEYYFPMSAQISKVEGAAMIACNVTVDHLLEDCKVTFEDPVGFGFGDAALKISRLFRVAPETVDGVASQNSSFSTRISFKLPPDQSLRSFSVGQYVNYVPWVAEPTSEQITAAYPSSATGPGMATLACRVRPDGALDDCHLATEAPPKMGFGEAAFSLAPLYKAGPPPFAPGDAPLTAAVAIYFLPPVRQTPIPAQGRSPTP